MKRTTLLSRNHFAYATTIVVTLLCAPLHHAAAQESAEDVLDKCMAVMGPPIQYRLQFRGLESLVQQKVLPDGSFASRIEFSAAKANFVYMVSGQECYVMHPDENHAMDVQFRYDQYKDQATGLASAIRSAIEDRVPGSAEIKGIVDRDGKQCLHIESDVSPEITAPTEKNVLFGTTEVPAGHRFLIEKETCVLVKIEALSEAGSSIAAATFGDVKSQADLPDDLFTVPDGFRVDKPKSSQEQMEMIQAIHRELKSRNEVQPEPPSVVPKSRPPQFKPLPVEKDPKTGRIIWNVPRPPRRTRDAAPADSLQRAPTSPVFRAFLWFNVLLFVGVVAWFLVRKARSR